jgi:maltose alpha-D-glucosyltransferase/alpha-amylase
MELPAFKDLVFYEIYPNSFKDSDGDGFGDLQGIISKLDYIASLGFNAIWLNPIYESPFLDGGYDISDVHKVAKRYGTNADLKKLVKECHDRGIRLFLDLVPGHVSSQNPDFIASGSPEKNEFSDVFIWNNSVWDLQPGYRWISGMFPRDACYMVNFFAHQPAINYGFNKITDPRWQVSWTEALPGRKYLEGIMAFWLGFDIDGFRVDMADSLVKDDPEKEATIQLWQLIREDLKKQGVKPFYLTSEWSYPQRALKAGFDSDFVLDHWTNFSHFLFRQDHGEFTSPLLMNYDYKLYQMFKKDVKQRVLAAKKNKKALSIISGNHDTWRIANFLSGDSLKLAYLFILTMPGVPYIYYGDELGFKTNTALTSFEGGYQRTGSRLPMKFDSSVSAGFSSSRKLFLPQNKDDLTAEAALKDQDSLVNLIAKLIKIRKENKDLVSDDFAFIEPYRMAYQRKNTKVFINLLNVAQEFKLKDDEEVVFSIGKYEKTEKGLKVSSHGGVIIERKK